jgi:hypothetical protein
MKTTVFFTKPDPMCRTTKVFEDKDHEVKVAYEIGFVVITDGYGAKTAYPAASIERVEVEAPPRRW